MTTGEPTRGGKLPSSPLLSPRTYEVLYYKRTNKAHTSKGTVKMDGILKVYAPPLCTVTLVDVNNEVESEVESEDESEDEEILPKRRQKVKWKPARKKSGTISTGTNRNISRQAFGLATDAGANTEGFHIDDIVVLSQFECQIISIFPSETNNKSANNQQSFTCTSIPQKRLTNSLQPSRGMVKRQLVAKKLVPPKALARIADWSSKRAPPRQPHQPVPRVSINNKNKPEQDDKSDEENMSFSNRRPIAAVPLLRKVNPLLQSKSKKRRLLVSSRKEANKQLPLVARGANISFPGAIGNVVVPPSVRAVLRPHQEQGVIFLWNCLTGASPALCQATAESEHISGAPPRGVILADEMGLGKTLMTICTVYALHRRKKHHRFIVVCPSSLVSNWGKEFDKWLGKASQPKRVVIRKGGTEGVAALRAFVPLKPHQSEVLIVSYDLFRLNSSILAQAKNIGCLVVDEGHRLKNTGGSLTLSALNALQCDSRILITGTPIQNNLSEFHNVASFVCPGLLGDLSSFRKVYERPIAASNSKNASFEQNCRGQAQSRALEAITKTFMLRRLQKDILKYLLPPRIELLLFCRPSIPQCAMYRTIAAKSIDSSNTGVSADALTTLTKLRKLCSHPCLLDTDKISKFTMDRSSTDISLSGKLSCLESLLRSIRICDPSDKVVVVSNFTSALSIIEAALERNNWLSKRLDGTTALPDRQPLVDSFNRGTPEQSFVFLLSSKAGGCGLNLIGANRLIMFDPDWNPATDMQAMARIYRQGQTKSRFIYRFFTSGTVEEVIYQRQFQKGNLATLTVDGPSVAKEKKAAGFSKEELRDCFTLKEGCDCDTKMKVGARWPEYSGSDGLRAQGCCDEPLLNTVEEESSTLAFVHVMTDNGTPKDEEDDTERESSHESASLSNLCSSDEECEFE